MENENSKLLHVFIAGLREYPTAGIIARTVPTGRTDRTCQACLLLPEVPGSVCTKRR